MPTDTPTARLDGDLLDMMARGVSVIVSSSGPDLTPSVMRAVGSDVAPDGRRITVFLSRSQSNVLLQDIARSGRVSVVFSEPFSHRSVQIKSDQARVRAITPEEVTGLPRYLQAMQRELDLVGFSPAFAAAMLAHQVDDLSAVEFEPHQAFDQTPGPRAGDRLTTV